MVSGVISVIISSITAYVTQITNQSLQSIENKVKDVSMVCEHKKDDPIRKTKSNLCRRFRSMTYINRLGFVVSLILILTANIVMLNARIDSKNCE
jgi:hypothetical protein